MLLATYLAPQKFKVAQMALLLLSSIALELLCPQILGYFIDSTRLGVIVSGLLFIACLYIGTNVVSAIATVLTTYVSEQVGWAATNALRADLTLHCLRLDLPFHHTHSPGELVERIDGDVTILSNFFSQFTVQFLGNILLLIGVLAALFYLNIFLGIAFAVFTVVAIVILNWLRRFAMPHWKSTRQVSANFLGFLEEHISGREDIHFSGAVAYVMRTFFLFSRNSLRSEMKAGSIGAFTPAATIGLFGLSYSIAFLLGAYLLLDKTITLGQLYLLFSYISVLNRPVEGFSTQLEDLQQASACIARVGELLQIQSSIVGLQDRHLPQGKLALELEHVFFSYHDQQPVLQDITFTLEPGQVLGLLGRTGSGKSTCARLILRMHDPQSGTVRLSNVDLSTIDPSEIGKRVGMVTQKVQLFHGTVRDNLTFFDKEVTDDRLLELLNDLGLSDWYKRLPTGLDTELDGTSSNLSAGEAQLLAFARVFLRNPGIVLLDEASSRLDAATEALIDRAVDKLLYERTAIIIAHHLETVRRVDTIMILEDGKIIEYGPRVELEADRESHFSRLLSSEMEELV
jgi:ABC-type multidrug transport system fused ATPase/permease subunit